MTTDLIVRQSHRIFGLLCVLFVDAVSSIIAGRSDSAVAMHMYAIN